MPAPSASGVIDRVDGTDRVVGSVRRGDVFREGAGFRVTHVLLGNRPGELLLQQVGAARDRSPLRWGSSVAAYLHRGESYADAAERRVREEIGLELPLRKLGNIRMFDDGATKFIEIFHGLIDRVPEIREPGHIEDLRFWSRSAIEETLTQSPATFTETFGPVYRLYIAATA